MRALFDTNIMLDYLKGLPQAKEEFPRHKKICLSLISWMEVLVGARNEVEILKLKQFLSKFDVLAITTEIAEVAITLRQQYRIKLPDALIWATAEVNHCLFITRNTKDFPDTHPSIRVPYRI